MNIKQKLKVLDAIYDLFDASIGDLAFACKKHCSVCCSCNLVITTLEGYHIVSYLKKINQSLKIHNLELLKNKNRFIPKITVNNMAEICSHNGDIPEENIDHNAGTCPFLFNKECTIYEVRPFGCRSMLSITKCFETGFAQVPSYILSIHNLFNQYIEHIDSSGYTSNFIDILIAISSKNNVYDNQFSLIKPNNLTKNQLIKILMIPPEHVDQVQPLLKNLEKVCISILQSR